MITEDKFMIERIAKANYWLGRAMECCNNEDIDGVFSNLGFFKNFYRVILRAQDQRSAQQDTKFKDIVMDISCEYNELMDIMESQLEGQVNHYE